MPVKPKRQSDDEAEVLLEELRILREQMMDASYLTRVQEFLALEQRCYEITTRLRELRKSPV